MRLIMVVLIVAVLGFVMAILMTNYVMRGAVKNGYIKEKTTGESNDAFPEKTHEEIIEEMRSISDRQLKTGEGDQEIAKLSRRIVNLHDLWKKVYNTHMVDEFKDMENRVWDLVDAYKNAMRGKGSLSYVLDSCDKISTLLAQLSDLAKIRLAQKQA